MSGKEKLRLLGYLPKVSGAVRPRGFTFFVFKERPNIYNISYVRIKDGALMKELLNEMRQR